MRMILPLLLLTSAVMAQDPQEGWEFAPEEDNYTEEAWLDLRQLNENTAGENGFIRTSPDGEDFVTGDGTPIRFWATGGGDGTRDMTIEDIRIFGKFLAKKGVNMVRFHGAVHSVTSDIMEPNRDELDAIWKFVAAMKEEGIYSTISPFWPNFIDEIPTSWDLGDYSGTTDKPWGLLYFNERFQEAYKSWLTTLFTENNPYTGIPLKDEPAVGLIQMLNEDGVFFWTIQGVKPSLLATMEEKFHSWLVNKYGAVANAYAAWNNLAPLEGDDPANGKMGLYIIYEATIEQAGGKDLRLSDQVEFYAETQRSFYQEVYDHLRSLGCQQLINTTNWKTASNTRLLDAERYTNDAADVLAVNRYYSAQHNGPFNGWRIQGEDTYVGASVLFNPHQLPVNVKQVSGKPFVMTESSWPLPHKYLAESVFLTAAYASLTGFDSYYWFSPRASVSGYSDRLGTFFTFADFNLNYEPIFKFNISTPGHLSPFPANALLYRLGYVSEGDMMVNESRPLQDLYDRAIPLVSEESGFDPNRDSYDNQADPESTEVPPVAYLAGKVRVSYGEGASEISPQLGSLLDFENKIITSSTGQLIWNYEKGQCTLDAPSAQGVTGFFSAEGESFELSDVQINVSNEYAAILLVAMDNKPLASSSEILVQVNTLYETTNYSENAVTVEVGDDELSGFEIVRTGQLPWKAAVTKVNLRVSNPEVRSAHLLDVNGYKVREISVESTVDGIELTLPANAMYVVLNTDESTVTNTEEEIPDSKAYLFPNPSSGGISIVNDEVFDTIQIVDLSGKEVYRRENIRRDHLNVQTDLGEGMYIVRIIRNASTIRWHKLVISGT